MKIKFNNIRDLADARYAAAAMAEWIGFSVGKTDSLPAGKIQEIIGWCAGPKLILEAAEGTGSDVLSSLMQVLPVDGIEVEKSDFSRLKTQIPDPQIIWIIKDGEAEDNCLTHSRHLISKPNTICNIDPAKTDAKSIFNADLWAISVNCLESNSDGTKQFDLWNDFFEEAENY